MVQNMCNTPLSSRRILVCHGTGCVSTKGVEVREALEKTVAASALRNVTVDFTGCHGFCEQGPLVIVEPDGVFYVKVQVSDVQDIVKEHLIEGRPVARLFYKDPKTGKSIAHYKDIEFYSRQQRLILRNCGHINPERIEDFVARANGYQGLKKALFEMTPTQIIDEIKRAGLRGLGGAGFPTAVKWESCRRKAASERFVVCNADEGDPGAFQDRSVLEGDPHSVLEGMIIAGYAVGANHGIIYVRAEYPLAVKRLQIAITQAREKGFLGKNILGSGFDFDIAIFQGAGAFVCGESTALVLSIEGKRGMPKPLPRPRTTEVGLWGKPTLLNNVKTFASVPVIITRGAAWYAKIGTEKSKGTAVFALTGKIANSGLIEVPMGTTLREIIYDIGGGIPGGRAFKAVQTGGPSGGCLPAEFLDVPVDFDSLTAAGSMMGSGGMVIMDEDTCMVDVARYFLDFTQKESCGACVPCRLGTKQMLNILEDITAGKGRPGDIELLTELAEGIKRGAICGLGESAPNPVLTTIKYFRSEYEAHIHDKKCPARVCKPLIHYRIVPDKCKGCGLCLKNCPATAITGENKQVHIINQSKCVKCGVCLEKCPPRFSAVECVPGVAL